MGWSAKAVKLAGTSWGRGVTSCARERRGLLSQEQGQGCVTTRVSVLGSIVQGHESSLAIQGESHAVLVLPRCCADGCVPHRLRAGQQQTETHTVWVLCDVVLRAPLKLFRYVFAFQLEVILLHCPGGVLSFFLFVLGMLFSWVPWVQRQQQTEWWICRNLRRLRRGES